MDKTVDREDRLLGGGEAEKSDSTQPAFGIPLATKALPFSINPQLKQLQTLTVQRGTIRL